ncbi:MAG: hypothetical protein V4612_02040 [Pseudomonadota bacterium]
MNSGLLINLVLAAIAITFFFQFLSNKKHAQNQLKEYEDHLKDELEKHKETQLQYQAEINNLKTAIPAVDPNKTEDIKVVIDSLWADVEKLRKEKDEELKMRLEAEKQIDLALQKTKDVQRRIDDWKIIQEANLQDATDSIVKVGNDLYDRLIINHRAESETIRNKVDDTVKNIYEYLEKIVKQVQFLNVHNIDSQKAVSAAIGMNSDAVNINHQSRNLEDILKSAHLQPAIDYFMHHNLPEEVKKSVLCETMIALDKNSAIIVDIKSAKFFLELFSGRTRQDPAVETNFQQRIDRYLTYLTNPKYRSNIINYFSKQQIIVPTAQNTLIMLVPSEKEVEEFKKLGAKYIKTLADNNINLHSLKSFSNLIFGE